MTRQTDFEDTARRRRRKRLTEIQLAEVSVVNLPANAGARHVLFKNLVVVPEAPAMTFDPAAIQRHAEVAVAKVAAEIAVRCAAVEAIATRLESSAGDVAKATGDAGQLAEALELARGTAAARARNQAGDEPAPAFWQRALRLLGERLAPDASPAEQMDAALATRDGQFLVARLTGDARVLAEPR